MPRSQQQNAGRVGRMSEHLAAAWLLKHNDVYTVMMPDSSSCDLLMVFPDGRTASIQVKTAYWSRRGYYLANCAPSGGGSYSTVDYLLVVLDLDLTHIFYLIPTSEIQEKSHMRLSRYSQWSCDWEEGPTWTHRASPRS